MPESSIQVVFDRGVYLPEAELWLDPHGPKPLAFVSHAHADHVAPHRRAICSSTTRTIVEKRFGGRGELIGHDFGEAFEIAGFRGVLLPAGHILGSAQLWLERMSDGESLLYTGDFKTREGVACEAIEWRSADTLIMETTYGVPKYRLPPSGEVIADLVRFVREALEEGEVPMLGAYSLGKAQEIIVALHRAAPELRFLVHSSVSRMTEIYRDFGYDLPEWQTVAKTSSFEGQVVVAPPSVLRSQQFRRVKNRVTAMVSGWGIDAGAKFRYQVDEVFPLSDHADYDDLLDYVEKVDPTRVLTLHGFAGDFARDLRERGREAWSLIGVNQLELGFSTATATDVAGAATAPPGDASSGEGEFAELAATCERLAATTGKLKKIDILAAWFAELEPAPLGLAALFLTGRAFGRSESTRALQTGWAIQRRAVLAASGWTEAEYRERTRGINEPGRATRVALEGRTEPRPQSLEEVRAFFESLAAAAGPAEKTEQLADRLARCTPTESQVLVGILTGDLRIGLKEGLVEEALASTFGVGTKDVRRAHMLTGDLAYTARLAASGDLDRASLTPFVPVQVMLASPEDSAAAIWKRLGTDTDTVWLEDKYDGIRAQLHRVGDRIELFSRDLRSLSGEFSELIEPARRLAEDCILDGEIIAFAEGRKLTFFDLQKRLGRRHRHEGDLFFGAGVPVRFIAFDLLWKAGESFIDQPLAERRRALETLRPRAPFEIAAVHHADSEAAVERAFKAARQRDNEGLIAKAEDSAYSPGRRGLSWLKLKKPMATLDCVVVKAEEGHGRRSHVLSDYTFAVRDTRTDELSVIGKAYSGLTDAEIEELTEHFREHTLSKTRRVHQVVPNVVLEIAFDSIQPSKRHASGLALRFPRIVAIRRDKTPDDIDTLDFARKLAGVGE